MFEHIHLSLNYLTKTFELKYLVQTAKLHTNAIQITFGIKTINCVSVVPMIKHPDVTPYNKISCPSRTSDRVRPTALRITTLYRHSPILRESFSAAIFTCGGLK